MAVIRVMAILRNMLAKLPSAPGALQPRIVGIAEKSMSSGLRASPLCRHLRFGRFPRLRIHLGEKPASVFSISVDLGRFRLRLKGTLDLLIGVRIPASQFPANPRSRLMLRPHVACRPQL